MPRWGCFWVERIGIEELLDSGYRILPCLKIWDLSQFRLWQPEPKALVREEKERPVFENGPTESSAEIVLSFLGLQEAGPCLYNR